jgi:hypothetical protein
MDKFKLILLGMQIASMLVAAKANDGKITAEEVSAILMKVIELLAGGGALKAEGGLSDEAELRAAIEALLR